MPPNPNPTNMNKLFTRVKLACEEVLSVMAIKVAASGFGRASDCMLNDGDHMQLSGETMSDKT